MVLTAVCPLSGSWVNSTAADVSGCRTSGPTEPCSRSPSHGTETSRCSAAGRCTAPPVSPAQQDPIPAHLSTAFHSPGTRVWFVYVQGVTWQVFSDVMDEVTTIRRLMIHVEIVVYFTLLNFKIRNTNTRNKNIYTYLLTPQMVSCYPQSLWEAETSLKGQKLHETAQRSFFKARLCSWSAE